MRMNHHLPVTSTFNYYDDQDYHDPTLHPLGYQALQPQHVQFGEHQQQAIAGFQQQQYFPPPPPLPHQFRQQAQQQHAIMATYPHDLSRDEDLAELQKLSNEYEPEATGPLVGQRESSKAIARDYASADPIFQAKTAALPQKYSHYRSVRGDGRCGWRSMAFGYFETLVNLQDGDKFLEEELRLRLLSEMLEAAGFSLMLYEDFSDVAFDLLNKLALAVHNGKGPEILLASFNDETMQNYIITYLKTLTAAWMKTRQQEYAPWLLGQSVAQYCDESVMPIGSEIDNVSLSALKDVLLSPAGVALEVLYLDRTQGSEVNMHRFDPVSRDGFVIGTVRLLYKPGHYDILYKAEDIPPTHPVVPTYLQYASHPHDGPLLNLGVSEFTMTVPGMSLSQGWMSNSAYPNSDLFSPSAPAPQCSQALLAPVTPQPQIPPPPLLAPVTQVQLVSPPTQMPHDIALRTAPHTLLTHPSLHRQPGGLFRSSVWEIAQDLSQATLPPPTTQTAIFRNSHYNMAHYLNPDFQPEEWHPQDHYVSSASKTSRHKKGG